MGIARNAAIDLFQGHVKDGEPLTEEEVRQITRHGVADWTDFDLTGGGLYILARGIWAPTAQA